MIKQEIAGILWGPKEKARVSVEGDREIVETLKLFPQAEQILAHRDLSKIPMTAQRGVQAGDQATVKPGRKETKY
jgi:predicted transcriptional regulator